MARKINKQHTLNVNLKYYEEELSPFGKKVLHVMIDNWKSECERNRNIVRQQPVAKHTKKVLNFRASEGNLNETLVPQSQNNLNNGITDIALHNVNSNENDTQKIPKSTELIKTMEINNVNTPNTPVINNIINQQNNTSTYDGVPLNLNVNRSDPSPSESNTNFEINNLNTVEWNDMFDTELITPNVNENKTITYNNNDNDTADVTIKRLVRNRDSVTRNGNYASEMHKGKKQSKMTDKAGKQIKKCENKLLPILRKENYMKTVKKWLNNIQSNNIEDLAQNYETALKTENVKPANCKIKKVVQAQLANKGGVMKFGKPKNLIVNQKELLHDIIQKVDETIKEKREIKSITPIKSQMPEIETVYEICILDEMSIQHLFSDVKDDDEFIIVLIYSNGFSQLNCHHTDDSCVPEGIMLCLDNIYYYCKGTQCDVLKRLVRLLENNVIICYDGKSILIYLMSLIEIEDFQLNFVDVKIGGSLLEPDNPPDNFKELQKLLGFVPEHTMATECPLQKCAWYITLLKESALTMKMKLLENSLWNVFTKIEMRLLPVLAGMEHRGVKVDTQKLKSMENILLSKMKTIELECYNAAGKTFQINSSMQVSAILYDELQLDAKSNVKIRETVCKGAKSTSESMLRSLVSVHPLPKLILEYRHLHKAYSTFLAGVAHYVKDGVVKSTWEQTAAATGRIASNNPNLQAIPKAPFSLNLFPVTDTVDSPLLNFRSVYVPREGYTFLAADFKHVECRVFAHAAADTGLLALLADGQDLFKALAVKWLNISESEVRSEDRERTKRIVYASLYGAGPKKLMDILGISYEQTLEVIASFNRTFPCLKSFGRSVVYRCEQNDGKLSTVCGRVRRFNNITSNEFTLKSQAERQAINFVVQGSAADLCKMAMVQTKQRLKSVQPHLEAHLVLQIHDELVWEVRVQDLDRTAVVIKEVMENCGRECGMSVSLPVSVSSGPSWGDITELTLFE